MLEPICIPNNADWQQTLVLGEAGESWGIADGAVVALQVRESAYGGVLLDLSTASDPPTIAIANGARRTITVNVARSGMAAVQPGQWVYDVLVTEGGVTRKRHFGPITIEAGVTRLTD